MGSFDAVVLAGGAGRRLGGVVKPEVEVAGRALVDHALGAVAGAERRVLVGPATLARPGVPTTLEDPPGGGPVAGIDAGLAFLTADAGTDGSPDASRDDVGVVVVLACDVPRAGAVVEALVEAAGRPGVDGARLVDAAGHPQHLVAAYRRGALAAALGRLASVRDVPVRALVVGLRLVDVADPGDVAADADTWPDVHRLDTELRADAGAGPGVARSDQPAPEAGRDDRGSTP
ncbi:molybdenum cofactor guanylyltransferase [Cellulomonas composti]|uniref:MobA-like NTP transferase domain-containing protein n=1 Tax=Cellulomonas composti TaxID=266130 RepID=A0A511J858_9CELL|nr:NTP transferase domain-containing protein [Cellulomonas composti]GEL94187.1 hypothetical protein CCO02nite_08450 [Cellulomonas composti]